MLAFLIVSGRRGGSPDIPPYFELISSFFCSFPLFCNKEYLLLSWITDIVYDMEIEEVYPPFIYSIRYDRQEQNEFHRLFTEWNDVEAIINFLEENEDYLIGKYMKFNIEKLAEVAKPAVQKDIDAAKARKENSEWLRISQEIALNVHCHLRDKKMTKTDLAKAMNVSPSYIGKLLKGNENLTLETICKLEKIINRKLIYTSRTRRNPSSFKNSISGHFFSDPQAEYRKK